MSLSTLLHKLVITLLLLVPPYVTNGSPPLITKIFKRQCTPIDLGRNFLDKRRIFGDGKTYEGFVGGVLTGYTVTLLVYKIVEEARPKLAASITGLLTPLDVLVICVLALLGDLLGAFIKRRLGLPRGAPAPLLDQLDFLMFPLLYIYYKVGIRDYVIYIMAIAITVGMHVFTNFVAYKLGIKSEPW